MIVKDMSEPRTSSNPLPCPSRGSDMWNVRAVCFFPTQEVKGSTSGLKGARQPTQPALGFGGPRL